MKYDFITIGGATEDISFFTQEGILIDNKKDILKQKLLAFEYGAKMKIDKSYVSFGGGAANAAVNMVGLGFKVAVIISVGKDNRGQEIIKNLKEHKVDVRGIQKQKAIESGFSFILFNPEKIVFSNRAANSKLKITHSNLQMIKKTKWVYITSLSGKWEAVLNNIFSINNINIAWNPGHIQLKSGMKKIGKFIKRTTVLLLNKDEAIELVLSVPRHKKMNYKALNDVKNLLKLIHKMGTEIVVITNGKNGADTYNGVDFYHQDILREKKRVDATGVGDAFGSTFVAGLELYNGDIQKSMLLGVKVAASVIGQQGAQNGLLRKHEL